MRGRRRHGRPHLKRQNGILFQDGGLLLDSEGQSDPIIGGMDGQDSVSGQTGTLLGNSVVATAHVQTHVHPAANTGLRLSSSETDGIPSVSMLLLSPTSLENGISVSTSEPQTLPQSQGKPSSTSFRSAGSYGKTSTPEPSTPPKSSALASTVASLNASQSSAATSPAHNVNTVGHSVEVYGGIVFGGIIALACIVSFVAWLIRSQRKSMCCCGKREEEDVENQDLGLGLGIYLDKPGPAYNSQEVKSTPIPGSEFGSSQPNPFTLPAIQNIAASSSRYPMTTPRPAPTHLLTTDTVEAPNRVLGPLQIKNYVSGDFPSSCDEGAKSPNLGGFRNPGVEAARESATAITPRFFGDEGQALGMPWPPLNIRSKHALSQVNMTHSPWKKGETARTGGEEEFQRLPTPRFNFANTPKEDEEGNSDGWGATLRSTIYNALSGLTSRSPKPEDDKFTKLPASRSYSNRRSGDVPAG